MLLANMMMFVNAYADKYNWTLVDSTEELSIDFLTCDSITYKNDNGEFYQLIWNSGSIVDQKLIHKDYALIPNYAPLEYSLFSKEDDGEDAIKTSNGSLAIFKYISDINEYILIIGSDKENSDNEYLIFDNSGLLKQIYANEEMNTILYMPNGIWISDSQGKLLSEIPYSEFIPSQNTPTQNISRATITRNPILQGLNIYKSIKDFIKKPMSDKSIDLWKNLNFGNNRYLNTLSEILEALGNLADIQNLLSLLDHLNELQFFDNAYVNALPAQKVSFSSATLPCEIIGLSDDPNICHYAHQRFETVVDFNYSLEMNVTDRLIMGNVVDNQRMNISNNGEYDFITSNIDEISHTYYYEPSLTMNVTIDVDRAGAYNAVINDLPSGTVIPSGHYQYSRKCQIFGDKLSFVTGDVNSNVVNIDNIDNTTADIICNFSDCPQGATCQILVTPINSDMTLIFNGEPNKDQQTVKVSGLTPMTDYSVESRIMYKNIPYWSNTKVSFKTTGPSGGVVSIDYENVTTNSALVTCKFTGVGAGVECGIIVEGEDGQTQTIAANNTEEEQDITISGLEPGTKYTCYGFVKLTHSNGTYYHQESNGLSFTTKIPGISGTWNVVETYSTRPFPGAEWETKTREYTLHLNTDGSVNVEGLGYDYIGGSWGYGNGRFGATCQVIATQTQNSWDRYEGVVDNIKNPQKITGTRYVGNMNQVTNVENAAGSIVMTR